MTPPRAIFVGGCMRSGTTIAQRLLCSSPATGPMTSECYYLTRQLDLLEEGLGAFDMRLAETFGERARFSAFSRDIALRYLSQARVELGAQGTMVWKNPELTRHFPRLARWFPNARFVVMVRDPRDVVASMLDVAERHRTGGVDSGLVRMGRDMERLAGFLKSYYQPLLTGFHPIRQQVVIVRYERLVGQPEALCAELSAALRIPLPAPRALEQGADAAGDVPYFDAERRERDAFFQAFWSPLYEGGLSASRTGRFRERLSPGEIQRLQIACADFNRLFPYWGASGRAAAASQS